MLLSEVLDARRRIVRIRHFLSPDECEAVLERSRTEGFIEAPITTPQGPVMARGIRNNTRAMYDDLPLVTALWQRLAPLCPASEEQGCDAVGLNERVRVYQYEPGQRFNWHYDGAFVRSDSERSELTVLLYLNEGAVGGATEFDTGLVVRPEAGMALLFDHGARHQGASVREGLKYVLRSDVMYRWTGQGKAPWYL